MLRPPTRRLRECSPPTGETSLRFCVHQPEDFANVLRQLAKLLFAAPQRFLGLLALGDVRAEADMPQELTGRREARLRVGGAPALKGVCASMARRNAAR